MPKAWKRRSKERSSGARALTFTQVAKPITYPELRAEQIKAGDQERIAWEKERDREWEREHGRRGAWSTGDSNAA